MDSENLSLDATLPVSAPPDVVKARPSWRTEPEIDDNRQQFLHQRLLITPDVQQGIYPFRNIRLTRADVEWLLANHEQGRGPIDWADPSQRERVGIDLRGADLRQVNLQGLPLACLLGGLTKEEWVAITPELRRDASLRLNGANLSEAHLEGALLRGAYMQEAVLSRTRLEGATLFLADLAGAYMRQVHAEDANMESANLARVYLHRASLVGTDLRSAFFDSATNLGHVVLAGSSDSGERRCALLADVHWDDCNLAVLDWRRIPPLGDEVRARALSMRGKKSIKEKYRYLNAFQAAVRANRQIANAMRAQGMNEDAVPFAYRAQRLQRAILWCYLLWGDDDTFTEDRAPFSLRRNIRAIRRKILAGVSYLFSWFLDILAGYGYKPERSIGIYVLAILFFTLIYHLMGTLPLGQALVFSVTAFHGRGFLPGPFKLGDPVTALAACEAVLGLFIEISFIATFTQRFFGR